MSFNFDKLKGKMVEHHITQKDLADRIGICPSSLNFKLSGKRDFTVSEMWMICSILGIDRAEDYFFNLKL